MCFKLVYSGVLVIISKKLCFIHVYFRNYGIDNYLTKHYNLSIDRLLKKYRYLLKPIKLIKIGGIQYGKERNVGS